MRAPAGLLPAYRFRQVTVYPGHDKPRLWADFHNYVRLYDRRQRALSAKAACMIRSTRKTSRSAS